MTAARAAATAGGLLIAGGLAGLDAATGPVLAPFVVSALAGPRETAVVAVVALVLVVISGAWNHNFGTGAYYVRCAVVLAGGAVSVLASDARERAAGDRVRFALLAAIAEVADGRSAPRRTTQRCLR